MEQEYNMVLANVLKSQLKVLQRAKSLSPSVNTYDFPPSVHGTAA